MVKKNHFTEKFLTKSNQELERIIESKDYVDEAKLAAKWILEARGTSINYDHPKKTKKESMPWIPLRRHSPEERRYKEFGMISFGIMLIIITSYFNLENLLTTRNSLVELKGTVRYSDVTVEKVYARGRFGNTSSSQKATLYIRLREDDRVFKLFENIGQDYSHGEFNRIHRLLEGSENVSIWINKRHTGKHEPKVYQIDINEQTIVDFQTIKHEHTGVFIFTFICGGLLVAFGLYSKYPKHFRRLLMHTT